MVVIKVALGEDVVCAIAGLLLALLVEHAPAAEGTRDAVEHDLGNGEALVDLLTAAKLAADAQTLPRQLVVEVLGGLDRLERGQFVREAISFHLPICSNLFLPIYSKYAIHISIWRQIILI